MKYRKLLITLLSVALVAVGMIAAVLPAAAENRRLLVRLVTGKTIVYTANVPAGTPLDSIKIPFAGVVGITDITPAVPRTPVTPQPKQQPTTPAPAPAPKPKPKPKTSPKPSPKKSHGAKPHHELHGSGHKPAKKPKPTSGPKKHAPIRHASKPPAPRSAGGAPTPTNPTFSDALPGPAPIGVPNFFIDRFRIPPFLLPIYQAAGTQYNIPWQVLAGINEIETNYGTNLNVSTAGAVGWMQFLPSTFKMYGVDANNDGRKDPYNPVDAIFSAARYLKAAGGDKDIKKGIFAYNHADWYVQSVLLRAKLIGGLPADLIGSLTGLTQGHFPVAARARYADDLKESAAGKRVKGRNAALPVNSNTRRRDIDIFSHRGAPVIAVNDGRIVKSGKSRRLGRYVVLQDVSGNSYTYGHLGSVSAFYPVPKERKVSIKDIARELKLPKADPKPESPATKGRQATPRPPARARHGKPASRPAPRAAAPAGPAASSPESAGKERLFANPSRPNSFKAGGERQVSSSPSVSTFKAYFTRALGLNRKDAVLKRLRPGAQVIAGTILGRIGKDTEPKLAPHISFEIRPAGRGAPRIDPKPILDGWKLLESTAIYRAAGKNPFVGPDAKNPTIGQILLLSKESLERRVLADPKIDIYGCGRRDIQAGQIDRRILATMEFLVASGMNPTISSLKCGHGYLTTSGNVSEHTTGDAMDVAKVNGIPIVGHQGAGSITELVIRRLLTLQGQMKPHQIISLMKFPNTDNTLSMADHYDHIHVGFHPLFGQNTKLGQQIGQILKPGQWLHLIDRLNQIPNPTVSVKPSKYAIPVQKPKRVHRAALGHLLGR
jgi:outer membrane biosynthesis protein TonB